MTDLPRGWDIVNAPPVGSQATVTLAASPGLCHVITSVNAQAIGNAATLSVFEIITGFVFGYLLVPAGSEGTLNWTGELPFALNAGLTVAISAAVAGDLEYLEIQGFDV